MRTTTSGRVDALSDAQLGAVTRGQCLSLGMTSDAIRWMLQSGRWQRVHNGVYLTHVGAYDWRTGVSAALLFCGEGAVSSHHTAARLHSLLDQDPAGVEVLIPPTRRVTSPARVHLATCVDLARRTASSGWPSMTTVEDTVLGLAERGNADNAIAWVTKACQRHRTSTTRLAEALQRRSRHRWRELLVDALSDVADGVESVLEYRYVRRVERPRGLPTARRQKVAFSAGRGRRTDNEYEPFRAVVELDGRLGHEGLGAFRDRARDNISSISGKGDAEVRLGRCRRAGLRGGPGRGCGALGSRLARRAHAMWGWLSGRITDSLKDLGCPDAQDLSG